MMTYTRSAIGLLTRQYRSVLKKCFLINCGLFALGAVSAHAAAPTPTLDDLSTKVDAYMENHATYDLTTTQGTNTHFLLLDNGSGTLTQYWYTPNESTQEKNNVLAYLLSNLTTTGASSEDYVLKNGEIYYTFDTTEAKLPKSAYTLTATDNPEQWEIILPTWNETTKKYEDKTYDLTLRDQGTGNVEVYYVWTTDDQGHPILTKSGASATHYNLLLKRSASSNSRIKNTTKSSVTGDFYNRSGQTQGSAIYLGSSSYSLGTIGSDFINNYVSSSSTYTDGGAIFNSSGKISSITGDFIGNYASSTYNQSYGHAYGGAIYNTSISSMIGSITGNFINNYTSSIKGSSSGGAIYNTGSIGSITGDFIRNFASYGGSGGAIYNGGSIGSITGDFIGNFSASRGGAIISFDYSIGSITGNFIGNYTISTATGTYDTADGGAIYHQSSTINNITGNFINNFVSGITDVYGGAISNKGEISRIVGDFINNSVSSTSSFACGGAISNKYGSVASIGSIEGNFIGNYAISASATFGGAINNYTKAEIENIVGDFIGNYAKTTDSVKKAYGGAIYNGSMSSYAPLTDLKSIITLAGNTFTGNYVNNNGTITSNSIYNAGVIYIANGATVTINDGYDGLLSGQLKIGSVANSGSKFNLSVDNGIIQTDNLGKLTNNGTLYWDLDVDLENATSDNISVNTFDGTGSYIIRAINLLTDKESTTDVTFISGPIAAYVLSATINDNIYSPGGLEYTVTYNNSTGVLTFKKAVADALLAANTTSGTRSFGDPELATASSVHELTDDLTGTAAGDFTITGTKSGTGTTAERATIDLGTHKGFDLANATTLNINDTKVINGDEGVAIKVSNANAKVNLDGAYIDGKITATADYDLTTKGETVLGAAVTAGTLTVADSLTNNGALTTKGGSNAGTISGTGSLSTSGAFENKSDATISQAVIHSGTGANVFTNNGTISGAVTNSGVFANNSSISNTVNNSGTFTNTGTISGAVTNTGTLTSAAEKMTGTVANNGTGVLNLSGALAKNISGTGTTNVDSTLALNSGAGVAGTLDMNSGTVTVSNGAITEHTIGEIKGTGNVALDINYGDTITADTITVATDTQASTLKITALSETGTRQANFEKRILFGTNGNTKLDVSELTGWNGSTDKEAEVALETNTIAYNENYGTHKWTETTALTVIGSADGLYDTLKYTTTISNDRFDPKAENLTVISQYSGTGSDDRKINFAGIQEAAGGTYTMKASTSLGETKAGKMTLDGEKNTTTKALTVVNLNSNAGYNLTNATELVLDEVKLTGASGNVITASNDSAKVTLNDAFIDGNIVKTGSNKMTVETSGNTTLNGNTSNVNLSNSGTLINNGTVTGNVTNTGTLNNTGTVSGDVTNNGTLNSGIADITGTITNNSTFNLSGDLSKNIGGAGTTVLQSATSTVAADRTISGTLNTNGKTLGMNDSAYETLTVGSLSGNANITINAKASTESSDKIYISSGASNNSALTISALNLDTTDLTEGVDYTQTMRVVDGNTSGVSLTFDDNLDLSAYNQTGVVIADKTGTDSVEDEEVAWDEIFGNWKQTRKKNTSLAISGTDMVYTETNYTVGPKVFTSYAEGLKELNQFASTDTKTFNAADSGTTHTIIEDLGNTVGKVSIDGKGGTLDFDGHEGFVMASGTEVSLKDVTAKNADGLADVKAGATLNLEDVTLENNGVLQNAGTINLNGSNSIDSIIAGTSTSAVLNVNSDWDMDTTVTGHTINVNGKKLTVSAGKLVASDSLNAESGSEIDIANNKVTLDKVNFEGGSKLNLKVDSLTNHGAIEANNITVENGANLSATLAQGIVKIGQKETLQLLKADNSNFNNFADSFDNEMYHFEKADNNGAYNISQVKTAEEVVEEAGGSATEARAAAAWVDGDQFEEGSTAAKVADALADLAQNNPQEFNNSLATIAPVDAPETQSAAANLTDKLLVTVGKYLSNQDIGGLTSGDALQDVTIWAKGYYGKSKLSNHGKIRGFDSTNKGVIAGLDKKLNKSVKLGGGFQYDDNDVDGYRRDIDVNTLTGFVYGEYRPSNWFVSGVASYGKSDYDEEKSALGIRIKDKHSAEIYSLQALTGYDFKYVTPEIGARYYRIKRHGYEDNIGQSVSGKDLDLFRGVFGLRTSYEFGMFKPEVYAGITYDFVSDKDNAIVSLPNGSSYMVDGKRLNRFGTEFSANVTAQVTDNTKIGAGYEGKFREHYQDHTGMISVKYEF